MAMTSKAVEALGFADGAHQGDRVLRALLAWLYAAEAGDQAMRSVATCYLAAVGDGWTHEQRQSLATALRQLAVDALGVKAPRARLGTIHPAEEAWASALCGSGQKTTMETNETWFAAVDSGVADGIAGTGAVYGIGRTYDEAVADAHSESGESDASYDVVRCTSEAATYIREHGGAPSARIDVDRNGVELCDPREA